MPDLLRLMLSLLALLSAYGAQLLLEGRLLAAWTSGRPEAWLANLAGVLYLGAMVVFGLVALPPAAEGAGYVRRGRRSRVGQRTVHRVLRGDEPDARVVRPDLPAERTAARRGPLSFMLRSATVLGATGLGIAASIVFLLRGETATVRWLWLASIGVLLLSQLPWPLALRRRSWDWRWVGDTVLVLALLACAFALRFVRLETLPQQVHGDMASHGLEARALLDGSEWQLFATRFYQIPTMAFVPAALSMRAFGNNLFGLRLTSVIGGTLTVLGLYLLTREMIEGKQGRRVALLAAAVLTVSYVHNHFSRIPQYMDPWPFAVFSLLLLVHGLKRRQRLCFVGSGVLLAICFQMYYAGRVLPIIVAILLLYLLLLRRDLLRGNAGGLSLLGLAVLLGLGPMIPFFARRPYDFLIRSRAVFLFDPAVLEHLMAKYQVTTLSAVVRQQWIRSLLLFHRSTDSSTQFGLQRPMLDSLTSPLLVLGLGVALRRLRRPAYGLALIWLLSMLVVGSFLTNNAPFWPRLVGILLPAALLVALAVERIWALAEELWGETASVLVALLLVLSGVFVGLLNWQLYVDEVDNNAQPRARIGRYVDSLDPDVTVCLVNEPFQVGVREIAFLSYPRRTVDLPADVRGAGFDTCPGPRRTFILTDNHLDLMLELQKRYPNGVVQEHRDGTGSLVFVSYLLDG